VPVDVLPATTIATPPATPDAEVRGESVTRVESAKLAVTGANVIRLVLIGLLAIAAGLLAIRSRRD
jgi:hypothetical protein